MSQVLRELLADPYVWGVVLAVGALIRTYVKRRITSGVDHQFALRLEDHKQSLHFAAESARYHFERDLAQANLYTSKGHAAAVEVHQAMRVAHGSCLNLRGLSTRLSFEEFNEKDLVEHMSHRGVPDGKQQEILAVSSRSDGINELQTYLRMLDVQRADRDLGEAENTAYRNELYFDDNTIDVVNQFFAVLHRWMAFIHFPPDTAGERKERPTFEEATTALEAVHTVFRDQLRGGGVGVPRDGGGDDPRPSRGQGVPSLAKPEEGV